MQSWQFWYSLEDGALLMKLVRDEAFIRKALQRASAALDTRAAEHDIVIIMQFFKCRFWMIVC